MRIGCIGGGDDQYTAMPLHLCHRPFHLLFDTYGRLEVSAETFLAEECEQG
jgi:hypothetical protein